MLIKVIVMFVELEIHIVRIVLKLADEIFEDIKLCYEFDKRLNFWCEKFEYKWSDISLGVMGGIYLKDCDYF